MGLQDKVISNHKMMKMEILYCLLPSNAIIRLMKIIALFQAGVLDNEFGNKALRLIS